MSTEKYTGSITLASIKDGADGILYDIQANHEKIYKFFDSSKSAVFSPKSISFKTYKTENGKSSLMHPNSDYDTDIALAGYANNKNFSHLWYFLNKLTGQKGEQKENLLTVARTIEDDAISFNFHSLFDYSVSEGLDNNQSADVADFEEFINLLKTENGCFIYKIFKHSSYNESPKEINLLAVKPIQFEFGTSEDMAKFALTANDIQMAVNNSKLVFDATYGLTVQNGGLRIISKDGTKTLMEYDPNNNALKIVGSGDFTGTVYATNGEFRGTVYADNGEFKGTIKATTGNIGGFIIDSEGLYSIGGAETENGYNTSNSNIRLLGESGQIYAENITLGVGAKIDKYIELGKARLWNPDDEDAGNKLLEAGGISLSQKGELILDGDDSKIYGNSFSITPDMAIFNNVNVYGKISTVVFEQNHVQSVGGAMIFKPSYKVEGCMTINNKTVLTLDKEFYGKIDEGAVKNYVYLVKEDGSLIQNLSIIEKNSEYKTVTLSSNLNLSSEDDSNPLVSLIDIGTEGSLVIGINSNDGGTGFLRPCGLTIAEFNNSNRFQNPKVFLGDLDKSGIIFKDSQGSKGFGLYSENVYLTGSLTTQRKEDSTSIYAGINTLNSANATKFAQNSSATNDTSKIVFWAGATNVSSITNAPFQVTEQGSLYAAQGLFEGAIISKSIIKGTDIYAARIHGEGESPNGLSFYDTNNGIVFYNGDSHVDPQSKEEEVFSIGKNGLKTKDDYFIKIQNGQNDQGEQVRYIKFVGDEIQTSDYFTNKTGASFLHLKDNQILGSHIEENNSEKIHANISFDEEELSFGLNTQGDFVINSNEIQLNKDTVKMNKTVLFGERLKYEQTTGGYNLYVL